MERYFYNLEMINFDQNKRVAVLHLVAAILLIGIYYADRFMMPTTDVPYYYPVKFMTIGTYLLVGLLVWKNRLDPALGFDISNIAIYVYGFVGTVYWHPAYVFTFFEAGMMMCFCYVGSLGRFLGTWAFGAILGLISIHYMPEIEILRSGETLKPHLQSTVIVFAILTLTAYYLFNRQRAKLDQMTLKFASIGRQSTFLLHELKAPLARFLSKQEASGLNEADHIFSIIQGVELLTRDPNELDLNKLEFSWDSVRSYLDDEFSEHCRALKISFQLIGLEGRGKGQISTIKLALRNLVKNGIESILEANVEGTIKVEKTGNEIRVCANGRPLSDAELKNLFQPFYTTKKNSSNFGIGLHLVQTVAMAHKAQVSAAQENEWSVFRFRLEER
jgi:signal transduction histidine kinase